MTDREKPSPLAQLRGEIDGLNRQILDVLQQRAKVVLEIAALKREQGLEGYDPRREEEMLHSLTAGVKGPFGPSEVKDVFQTIFRSSLDIQDRERRRSLKVLSPDLLPAEGIRIGTVLVGRGDPVLFAGPCSIETPEQMETIAAAVAALPVQKILRAAAFKPRTSPYTFQGLREEGLRILADVSRRHAIPVVTEVLDTGTLEVVAAVADVLQIGARNMYNTELLKAVGRLRKPVLLKRGFMATIDELLLAAEYIIAQGNEAVMFCERGIRTFETRTRNTLDISAIPLLKQETSLPVIVDVSHALGRRDILLPCARAAMAAGADGLMIEAHDRPDQALSDGFQQIPLAQLAELVRQLGWNEVPVVRPVTATAAEIPATPLASATGNGADRRR